jgi:hypothetical protein
MGDRHLARGLLFCAWSVLGAGCGGRTGLFITTVDDVEPADSAVTDAALPELDVAPSAVPTACVDAGDTLIYVITADVKTGAGHLFSFDPTYAGFHAIGPVVCPTTGVCLDGGHVANPGPPSPFSMAVDRVGFAYVVYCDGELFRVSAATGECKPTGFVAPVGFSGGFGMGFAQDDVGSGETLYVASPGPTATAALATIQTTDFALNVVASFDARVPIKEAELTGTGAGALFAFYQTDNGASSAIGQIDKASARLIAQSPLPGLAMGVGWAFAFWGGDFYTFTAPDSMNTVVGRFRPTDGSTVKVAALDEIVVGAGVSTCAPQQ